MHLRFKKIKIKICNMSFYSLNQNLKRKKFENLQKLQTEIKSN